jgi:hypothetical protein
MMLVPVLARTWARKQVYLCSGAPPLLTKFCSVQPDVFQHYLDSVAHHAHYADKALQPTELENALLTVCFCAGVFVTGRSQVCSAQVTIVGDMDKLISFVIMSLMQTCRGP